MRYSFEFKLECVLFYKSTGTYPPVPKDVKPDSFKRKVREWRSLYDIHGADILKLSNVISFSYEFRVELIIYQIEENRMINHFE